VSSVLHLISLNIAKHRKRLGLSQEELAARCGLHRTYVGAVERGERNITIINLEKLATAMNIEVVDLLSPSTLEDQS